MGVALRWLAEHGDGELAFRSKGGEKSVSVVDTVGLVRIYFDNSHWNNVFRHPAREAYFRAFDRRREAVFPSVQ